jgi:hypothetical protein
LISKWCEEADSMKSKKRLFAIAGTAIIWVGLVNTSSRAGTVSGTFGGIADIEVQQFVRGQQVGPTVNYQAVPSTLNFTITANSEIGSGPFQFSLTNNVFSLDSSKPDPLYNVIPQDPFYLTFITDGVPGQSKDLASGDVTSSVYHLFGFQAGVALTDPTGQYIGPNGNGDPAGVLVTAEYVYAPWDSQDTGQTYTVKFTTDPPADPPPSRGFGPAAIVPEPSSVVMAVCGVVFVFSVALGRARRTSHLRAPTLPA